MAEIDVQRRGPSIWPWIVGLVVLALGVWLLAEALRDDEPAAADGVEQVGAPERTAPAAPPVNLAKA